MDENARLVCEKATAFAVHGAGTPMLLKQYDNKGSSRRTIEPFGTHALATNAQLASQLHACMLTPDGVDPPRNAPDLKALVLLHQRERGRLDADASKDAGHVCAELDWLGLARR